MQAGQLEEWDIVLYDVPGGMGAALGRVASVAAGEVRVERLEEDAINQVRSPACASTPRCIHGSSQPSCGPGCNTAALVLT